eukprot:2119471-Pleurochrysis_carterae.AAC.1
MQADRSMLLRSITCLYGFLTTASEGNNLRKSLILASHYTPTFTFCFQRVPLHSWLHRSCDKAGSSFKEPK